MMWGMVPFWFRGSSAKEHGLTTNNARLEGLKTSRLYGHAIKHSKRCVVICDGEFSADLSFVTILGQLRPKMIIK